MPRLLFRTALFTLLLCISTAAAAQDDSNPQPDEQTAAQWVEQLGDAEYRLRAEASAALMRDNTLDEDKIRGWLLADNDPERRRRLLAIAEHHIMRALIASMLQDLREGDPLPDRGAVGFSYDPLLPDNNPHGPGAGLIVLATMPGFPGHAYLQTGDIILAIDGRSTRSATVTSVRSWVQLEIGRNSEGDTISLTVYREGETFDVQVPCGSITALNEVYTTTGVGDTSRRDSYQEPLDEAMARLTQGLPDPEPLTPAE
ncbi:MAG: PDZ domain-containing protein [Phycisphaerales bacterium JB063]